jgi:hypothetical protein
MSHAFISICASASTALFMTPPAGDGGYQFTLFLVALGAGIGAALCFAMEKP